VLASSIVDAAKSAMRNQRGQTSVEYLCLLVGVVALAGALAATMPGVGSSVVCGFRGAVAHLTDGHGCAPAAPQGVRRLAGDQSLDETIARGGSIMGPPGGAGEVGRGPTQPSGRFGGGGGGGGGGRGGAEGERAAAKADEYKTYAIARDEVLERLNGESRPSTRAGARGRDIVVADPRAAAYNAFKALTRGPGVVRVSKTANTWTVDTPEGRRITLRNPSASSTRNWTVDVRPPKGTREREVHYKFVQQ
jgi:Flp pilus assembly pilin Flp